MPRYKILNGEKVQFTEEEKNLTQLKKRGQMDLTDRNLNMLRTKKFTNSKNRLVGISRLNNDRRTEKISSRFKRYN